MTLKDQQQLGKTLWNIADDLRGAMNADDFSDYMINMYINKGNPKINQIMVQTVGNVVKFDHFKINIYGNN